MAFPTIVLKDWICLTLNTDWDMPPKQILFHHGAFNFITIAFPKNKSIKMGNFCVHKAIKWKKMLDDGAVESMSEIARAEGLTRARVTQIMNLLKLPAGMQVFLFGLEDASQIRKYSERKLRDHHEQDQLHQSISDID